MYQDENKRIHLTFRNLNITENEERIITGNRCEALLNMRCIRDGSDMEIVYAAEGCIRIDEFFRTGVSKAEDVLIVMAEIFRMIEVCRDHLIMYNEIPVETEGIFCGRSGKEIRFMYIPGYRNECSVRESVVELIDMAGDVAVNAENSMAEELADFKNKIFLTEGNMGALAEAAEEHIREYSVRKRTDPGRISSVQKVSEEAESSEYEANALNGGGSAAAVKPDKDQKSRRAAKNPDTGAAGIKNKLKNFIDELVS